MLIAIIAATWEIVSVLKRQSDIVVFPAETLVVAGDSRSFRIVVPRVVPANCPVLLAFHGSGDTPNSMAVYSRLDQLVGRHGFVLVYPESVDGSWSADAWTPERVVEHPDVQFFDEILVHLLPRFCIDPDCVYIAGMSNSAAFAQRLTNVRASKIAATVACSGVANEVLPFVDRQVPIFLIAGSDDRVVGSVQTAYRCYEKAGHPAKLIIVDRLGHEWPVAYNDQIWNFLSAHSVSQK